jgi:hypothetical protein
MKRLLALLLGGLGLRALLQRRSRPQAAFDPPVEDLKAKLAESRATVEAEREEAELGEIPIDAVPDAPAAQDVDARRSDVHARARQAIDDLRES